MNRIALLILGFFTTFALLSGAFEFGRARGDDGGLRSSVASAPALPNAGSASAPAPAASSTTPAPPQPADVAVATKLYKNGSFFGLGILALYLGLFVWFKVDKKHAFYAATALGAVGLLVESIRRGDTPNAVSIASTLGPTIGIMIAGPGHVKATTSG